MRRRDALKGIGTLAGAGAAARLLSGCGDNLGPDGITNILVVMMENRSYDHYLGARSLLEGRPGNGLAATMFNPDDDGSQVAIHRATEYCVPDPPHGWDSSRVQWNAGANDGFVRAYRASQGPSVAPHVMGYMERDDLPITWALADGYATCDAWFSSLLGPTWPNRMYLHSGQSGGLTRNELPTQGGIDWRSIHHSLNDAGIPWAYYFQDLPFVPLFKGLPVQGFVKRFRSDFFEDAAAGTLPPVAFVEPGFLIDDDHPPHHIQLGQMFLASVHAALAASPQWNHSLLCCTYDEAGGFFDHVSPPLAADDRAEDGFDQLGFRVPTVVAGPYVKTGHVSSVVRDHTSVLAHIDGMFGLEPLTARVAAAKDLTELLDAARLEALEPSPPVELPALEVDESMIDAACYGEGAARREPTDLEKLADAGFFPAGLDRRGEVRETLFAMGDVLERLNRGRIRRGR